MSAGFFGWAAVAWAALFLAALALGKPHEARNFALLMHTVCLASWSILRRLAVTP